MYEFVVVVLVDFGRPFCAKFVDVDALTWDFDRTVKWPTALADFGFRALPPAESTKLDGLLIHGVYFVIRSICCQPIPIRDHLALRIKNDLIILLLMKIWWQLAVILRQNNLRFEFSYCIHILRIPLQNKQYFIIILYSKHQIRLYLLQRCAHLAHLKCFFPFIVRSDIEEPFSRFQQIDGSE